MITPSPKINNKTRKMIIASDRRQLQEQETVNHASYESDTEMPNKKKYPNWNNIGGRKPIISKLINTQTKQCTIQLFSPVKKERNQLYFTNNNNISLNTSESNSKNISKHKENSSYDKMSRYTGYSKECMEIKSSILSNKKLFVPAGYERQIGIRNWNGTQPKRYVRRYEIQSEYSGVKTRKENDEQMQMKIPRSQVSGKNALQRNPQRKSNKNVNNIAKYVLYPFKKLTGSDSISIHPTIIQHYLPYPTNQLPFAFNKHHISNYSELDLNREKILPQFHTWASTQSINSFNTLHKHSNIFTTASKASVNRNFKPSQKSSVSLGSTTMQTKHNVGLSMKKTDRSQVQFKTNKNGLNLPSGCLKPANVAKSYRNIFELLNSNLKDITDLIKRTESFPTREVLKKEKSIEQPEKLLNDQNAIVHSAQEEIHGTIVPLSETKKTSYKASIDNNNNKAISLKKNTQFIKEEINDSSGGIQMEDSFLFSSFNSEMYRNLLNGENENKEADLMSNSYDITSIKSKTINMNLMAIAFANIGEKKIRDNQKGIGIQESELDNDMKTEKTECQYEDVVFSKMQNRVMDNSLSKSSNLQNERWLLEIENSVKTQNDTCNIMDQSKRSQSMERVPISELK